MKLNKFHFLVISILCLSSYGLTAQKCGHVNLLNIMEDLPDAVEADAQALDFAEAQWKALDAKQVELQAAYEELISRKASLSPIEYQAEMKKLDNSRSELMASQSDIQQRIYDKRKELFEPIFARISAAIEETGKEEGYTLIFDQGKGAILYNAESQDISQKVRDRLLAE